MSGNIVFASKPAFEARDRKARQEKSEKIDKSEVFCC
jgi:hypothetical protein